MTPRSLPRRRVAVAVLTAVLLVDVVWGKGGGCDARPRDGRLTP